MNLLDLDVRWTRFNDEGRVCPCCGQSFNGIFDLGYEAPGDWPHGPLQGDDMTVGEDRLHTDLCRLNGRFFVRCVLPLNLRGTDEIFCFGPWAEVPEPMFRDYLDTFVEGPHEFAGGEALLANVLPGFESDSAIPCALVPSDSDDRPMLVAHDGPLAEAQRDGISFDDLLDIYAAAGRDIRPHLTQG